MILNSQKHLFLLISAGLVLLIAAAFEPLRHNEFIAYDDNDYITENPHVTSGLTQQSIRWAFTSRRASNWHPLTWLSHMLDVELFGLYPPGHHLHNLLLHTASTLLLFGLLYKMTGSVWCSAFVAMVFGIHPLRVESVAWASERKDVLSMLFFMLTVAAYLYYVKHPGICRYLLVLVSFALGLMAKPMLVTLPVVLILLDVWPLGRADRTSRQAHRKSILRLIVEKIPLILMVGASCFITYAVQKAGGSVSAIDLQTRIFNALYSYLAYIGKIFWPGNLAVLYTFPGPTYPVWRPLTASIFLIILTAVALHHYSRKSWIFTGWFWYIITLIPVIGIIQVGNQSMADRYTYLPSVGFLIALTWSAAHVSSKWRYQKVILGIFSTLAAIGMVIGTRNQTGYWKDSISLFEHTLAITKYNAVIHNNLGWVLWKKGNDKEAFEHLQKSLQYSPEFASANINMALLLAKRNEYDKAMDYLHKVLKKNPGNCQANYNLALILIDLKQYDQASKYLLATLRNTRDDPDVYYNMGIILDTQNKKEEAIAAYKQAIGLNPDHYQAMNDLGAIIYRQGAYREAADYFRQSLKINPDYVQACSNLALAFQKLNLHEESISYSLKVLETEPENPDAWLNLAVSQEALRQLQSASDSYQKAIQFDPNSIAALNNLAWLSATHPHAQFYNPAQAILLADRACSLTSYQDAGILDTLSAAYAADGKFKEAVQTAQRAAEIASSAGKQDMAKEISKRLDLYKTRNSYVETSLENPTLKLQMSESDEP